MPYTAERTCLVKNTTRAAALVAAAALASSGATGVANAQSGDFEIPILGGLTQSSTLTFPDMGSTDLGSMELIPGSAGVIPEGSTGGIGANKLQAIGTVENFLEDAAAGRIERATAEPGAFTALLRGRRRRVVGYRGVRAIDRRERALGAAQGRPRVKFTEVGDMLAAAGRLRR